MDDVSAAKNLIPLLDLTSLNDTDTTDSISAFCRKAETPYGHVASICVYPKFVPLVLRELNGSSKITTVINFPSGSSDLNLVSNEINRALNAGADEIDVVFPYKEFLKGKTEYCAAFLEKVRSLCPQNNTLKIILETGEYPSSRQIRQAAQLCIDAGADFIKTSTGKTKTSATPEAANTILETIKASKKDVGFKASGGIRTIDDAKKHLVLANAIMGPDWVTPAHFRIGASSLLTNLLETINKGY